MERGSKAWGKKGLGYLYTYGGLFDFGYHAIEVETNIVSYSYKDMSYSDLNPGIFSTQTNCLKSLGWKKNLKIM